MKKKINLGFDIGVASVGWSIIDEQNNLINYGARLFDDAASAKDGKLANQSRRNHRSLRRRLNRTKNRKEDFLKLLIEFNLLEELKYEEFCVLINNGVVDENNQTIPVVHLKCKGLKEKLTKDELLVCLFHYLHHRGYFYLTEEDLAEKDINEKKLKNHPSVIQSENLKKYGYYKGMDENMHFSNQQWTDELQVFLKNQKLPDKFNEKFLELFQRIRDFSEGPGNEKTPTKYGLYQYDEKTKKIVKTCDNLWDKTIGKCTIYPNFLRGGKNSPIAEVFNLLNDLNNLYFFNDKNIRLTSKHKKDIFAYFNKSLTDTKKKTAKSVTEKLIKEVYKNNSEDKKTTLDFYKDVFGYRLKDKKALFTPLNNTMEIANWLITNKKVNSIDLLNIEDLKKINDVFATLAKTSNVLKRVSLIIEKYVVSDETAKELTKSVKGVMQTHSLSYEAMLEYIPNGISYIDENGDDLAINQMRYFSEKTNIHNNNIFRNANNTCKKYIPKSLFENEIISPTVKRSFNQTINVLNKIIKLYSNEYEINNITIELARDKNTYEEKRKISDIQNNNKNELNQIFKNRNLDLSLLNELNSKTKLKLKLLAEQDYYDIYDGTEIDALDVIKNPSKYHEEHIIPYSVSYVDSRVNKVLTKAINNNEKNNLSPYQWLSAKGKYEEFEMRVDKLYADKKISKDKYNFLTYKGDLTDNFLDFIEKNLVDTRYASRLVLNTLQRFFNANKELYPDVKIKVINGSITNYARYNIFYTNCESDSPRKGIMKIRENFDHHAVDATILAFLGNNHKISSLIKNGSKFAKHKDKILTVINHETGEIIELDTFICNDIKKSDSFKLSSQIEKMSCKFSRPISHKQNLQLSDETIYGIKWTNAEKTEGIKIGKLNLLSNESFSEYFSDDDIDQKKLDKLLCYQEDKELYNLLKSIWKQYFNYDNDKKLSKNPFINYMKANGDEFGLPKDEKGEFIIKKIILFDKENKKKFVTLLRKNDGNKTTENIIVLKNQNNNAFLENLNAQSVRIYKNIDDKYVLVPINAKLLTYKNNKLVVDDNKLEKFLKFKKIENQKYLEIVEGMAIINKDNKLFYFNGGGHFKQNKLEIKSMFCLNEQYFKSDRQVIALSTIFKDYDFCELDELGNIYNVKKIEDFFN